MDLYKQIKKFGKTKLNEPMSKHTTFKIGGPADFFVIVESVDNLVELIKFVNERNINYYVIGGGSNILVSDNRFNGVVIKIDNKEMKIDGENIEAGAGCPSSSIAQASIKQGLSGFEWAIAVPGSIGGAVFGNAGAIGRYTKDSVEKVEVLRDGEVVQLTNEECKFGHKDSIFKHNQDIILRVFLKLEKKDNKEMLKKAMDHITHRNTTQPQGFPSAGCVFKNYKGSFDNLSDKDIPKEFVENGYISAGWLIEQAGLKGFKMGGAQVSDKHCNFIVNTGGAKAEDVQNVIEHIKEKVYDKFGINLEEEMQYVNF